MKKIKELPLESTWYVDAPDAMTCELLPQGFQSRADILCSHSFKGHSEYAMFFFSICSCLPLVKAKTPLSDVYSGSHGRQFTGTSRVFKSIRSSFRLLANSSTNLFNQLQLKGYFFPMTTRDRDWFGIEKKQTNKQKSLKLWVLEQKIVAEMCCQMVLLSLLPPVCLGLCLLSCSPRM